MVPLRSSLVDGELVIDVDPRTHQVFHIYRLIQTHFIIFSFFFFWYRKKLAFWPLIVWLLMIKTSWHVHWINDTEFVFCKSFFFKQTEVLKILF